jgi:hypothetical protein
MSSLDESRLDRFCTRAAAKGEVWVLTEGEDCAVVESNDYEESEVMPFWSDQADAAKAATGDWGRYKPAVIPLDEFLGSWLPSMDEDGLLVGPDWSDELEGDEVEPEELFRRLETARAARGD